MINRLVKYMLGIVACVMILAATGCAVNREKEHTVPDKTQAAQSKPKEIKIACIGDSITFGAGVHQTRDQDSYPAKLSGLLGSGYTVLNYGISGKTLLNGTNTPYRAMDFFEESKQALPDIVLIMLGTNDSKAYNWNAGEYEKQLEEFVDIYKGLPSGPEVYLMTCCAAFGAEDSDVVAFHVNKSVIANEVNPIIRSVAEKCRVPVIDIYEVTKEHSGYFVDGVHPNAEGNEVIAQAVYEAIEASGADRKTRDEQK